MSIVTRLRAGLALAISPKVSASSVKSSQELQELLQAGYQSMTGEHVGLKESLSQAAVFRCAVLISGAVSGMRIDIKDQYTNELKSKHAISKLINRRPNSWQTGNEFKKMLQNHLLFDGNAYALKVRTGRTVSSLIPILPSQMKVTQKLNGDIEYEYTPKSGKTRIYSQRDIFHLRGMSLDGIKGLSVLQYARETIGEARSAQRHGARLWKNGTRMTGALKHPGNLSDEAYNRLKSSLGDFKVDGDRYGEDLILEEGLDYVPFGMSSADAEFISSRKFSVLEIAMFFGVPPHMIGFTEKSTSWGSGIEQQSIGFVNYSLNDWFEVWEGAIERDLITDDDEEADFNTYPLLRGDEKGRWEANQIKLQMGAMNADEVRMAEGYPAKPNGEGQEFYPPPNVAQQEGSTDEP
ncbi:MAG: phage portal protein [Rhodopirellula sp.]|nr:phage portal protein [Rhodopirellula sp.]